VPSKCKFFLCLVLHNRVWTAARRRKHQLQVDDCCSFCDQEFETISHLLIACSFSREVWFTLFQKWWIGNRWSSDRELSLADWWVKAPKGFDKNGRRAFDSAVILICWMLWLERNACVFNRRSQSASELAAQVLEQVELLISARFHSLLSLGSVAAGRQHRDMASVLYFLFRPFGRVISPLMAVSFVILIFLLMKHVLRHVREKTGRQTA
jgi:hypothetical protein